MEEAMDTRYGRCLLMMASLVALGARAEERRVARRSPEELLTFAKSILKSGHPQAALAFLEDVVASNPGWADPYETLGDAYSLCGRSSAAVQAYEKFLTLAPKDPRAEVISRAAADLRAMRSDRSG
jgi:cytochrome c-type biogenesis protein CcmH/NrfG